MCTRYCTTTEDISASGLGKGIWTGFAQKQSKGRERRGAAGGVFRAATRLKATAESPCPSLPPLPFPALPPFTTLILFVLSFDLKSTSGF